MRSARLKCVCLLVPLLAQAVIIDRIAVVINSTQIVKDSDIERDIRVTDYLNGEALSLSEADRKKAAQRLIDQTIIRREIDVGAYEGATPAEVDDFLRNVRKQRGDQPTKYGLTEDQLRKQIAWQITVLHFIEQRFRPAVMVTEDEINAYLKTHPTEPREQIQEQIAGERVNQQFETWLNRARERAHIEYREAGLQ